MPNTDVITEKVYCTGNPSCNNLDASLLYANGMNNPMWIVWLMAMRWMGYNGADGYGGQGGYAALQNQISDNQNVNNVLRELTQNQNAMQDIANRTNTNIDFVRQSLCQLGAAIQQVEGTTKFSAERIINAANMGDANIIAKLQQCCCENKLLVTQQGYETRLAMKDQTYQLNERLTGIANGLQKGFSDIGYLMAQQKGELINNQNAVGQRIVDTLNSHWKDELSQALQDEKFKNSQLQQNIYFRDLMEKGSGVGCGCGA
jgi:hypothetical protein